MLYFTLILVFIDHVGIVAVGIANLIMATVEGIFYLPFSIRRYRMMARGEGLPPGPGANVEANADTDATLTEN